MGFKAIGAKEVGVKREMGGKVIAVTGAASGIGRALALQLASEGANLAISDFNEAGLSQTRRMVEGRGVAVIEARVDVSDRGAVYAWAESVVGHYGGVNAIINNAGVALVDTVEQMSDEDLAWIMGINFWGVVHGTRAFLPHVKEAGWGRVVNISSVFGLVGVPTQSAYNASKFAVRGFTEALGQELAIEGSGVRVTSVHPGGIDTNIARAGRFGAGSEVLGDRDRLTKVFSKAARTTPEQAAATIIEGMKRGRRRVLVGRDAQMMDLVQRLFPEGYQVFVSRMLRKAREARV